MHSACAIVCDVPHIQIRNVPPDVHARLKRRAAEDGLSLSEYLLQELTRLASLPTLEEMTERLRRRSRVPLGTPPEELVHTARDERDAELRRRVSGRR